MDLTAKNFDDPDEIVRLPLLLEEVVEVGGFVVGREVLEPGWRWSTHVGPEVGGDWCEAHHVGYTISGRWAVVLQDGRTIEFGPGDVFDVPPGHDSWTVGAEPCESISWTGLRTFFASKALLPERFLATILFTDIVDSTSRATEMGDSRWADLLADLRQATSEEIDRVHGREVKDTGDGVLAVFEGPASAMRCAIGIRAAAGRRGLAIRAGIHVGEVESSGQDVRGIAVHEAARVMGAAEPDEILVSQTTSLLSPTTPGVSFTDRGEHALKGIGSRRLFAVEVDDLTG